MIMYQAFANNLSTRIIGNGSRGSGGPWPLLNLRLDLHRNLIFVTENHLSFAKWPP